jgi:hypothetical protein
MNIADECTLPTAERPLRVAEFDDLFGASPREVTRVGPTHLRLLLTGPEGLRAKVEDLAARENECCSFFSFTVTEPAAEMVSLEIEVPPTHVAVLDGLAERASR